MGHRHLFSTAQMFEAEYQNLNHIHGRGRVTDNRALSFPRQNVNTEGVMSSNWSSVLRSNEHDASRVRTELPHYQLDTSGPSYDSLLPPSDSVSLYPALNYTNHPSSSGNYQLHEVEGENIRMNNGSRGSKRKMPAIPIVHERGSSSSTGYSSAGSSFDLSILSMGKPASGLQHWPWETVRRTTRYRGDSHSVAEGVLQRNVRSRSTLDMNISQTSTSNPFRHPYYVDGVTGYSSSVNLSGRSAGISQLWTCQSISSAAQQRILASDASGSIRDTTQILARGGANISLDVDLYPFNHISGRSAVISPHIIHGLSNQAVRGAQGFYSQRAEPVHRAMPSYYQNMRRLVNSPDIGLQPVREIYHSRHSWHQSTMGRRNSERSGQRMIQYETFRPLSNEVDVHDRRVTEDAVMLDHSILLHDSMNSLDQHRDMRLDTENMTYEELLALGERIGNVRTGLTEDLILKCLIKTIYRPSDKIEGETCVICLDEYTDGDMVGTFVTCGHSYHMSCIKKWLSMKNVCPICKAPALVSVSDSLKK